MEPVCEVTINPHSERDARRAIEDAGFDVHDANLVFRANCPNIDLIVYGEDQAVYVQVKSSKIPASSDHVTIDGTPWSQEQLNGAAPIFNKKPGYKAEYVVLVNYAKRDTPEFFVVPPDKLTELVIPRARKQAARPKKDGTKRSIKFRKELPRSILNDWRDAWHLLGKPIREPRR